MSEVVAFSGQGEREVAPVAEAHEHVLHRGAGTLVSLQQEHVQRGTAATTALVREARPVGQESASRPRRAHGSEKRHREAHMHAQKTVLHAFISYGSTAVAI